MGLRLTVIGLLILYVLVGRVVLALGDQYDVTLGAEELGDEPLMRHLVWAAWPFTGPAMLISYFLDRK